MQEIRVKGKVKSKKRPVNELDDDGNEKENLATVDTNQDTASNKDPGPVLENHTAIPKKQKRSLKR